MQTETRSGDIIIMATMYVDVMVIRDKEWLSVCMHLHEADMKSWLSWKHMLTSSCLMTWYTNMNLKSRRSVYMYIPCK